MNRTLRFKLLTAVLALAMLLADLLPLLPAEAGFLGLNTIIAFVRTVGALGARNGTYREARSTAQEINAYYDGLIAQAQIARQAYVQGVVAGERPASLAGGYVRMEAALEAERDAAIQMIEAEKNQARKDFERTLVKEAANVLSASPGGQRVIGRVRDTIASTRGAAVAVQVAAGEGRPIDALGDALARQVGDIPIVQDAARELGSMVGHKIDRALGGAVSKVERAIDNVQGEMGQAIDLLDQADREVARWDGQARRPVSLVEDSSVLGAVLPVDRASAALDVAASAYAGAAALRGALPAGSSRADMRTRIRGTLLDERLAGIRQAACRLGGGQTYCSEVEYDAYEAAAAELGEALQPAGDAGARYLVCYDIQTQTPRCVRMLGAVVAETAEETAEETATVEEAGGPIPTGTYEGTATDYVSILDMLFVAGGNASENRVVITVADDGTVTGSQYMVYTSGTHTRNDNITCTTIWHVNTNGVFSGQLAGEHGTIELTDSWSCSTSGTCNTNGSCESEPLVWQLDVQVSGRQMTGTSRPVAEDSDGLFAWSFSATRQ